MRTDQCSSSNSFRMNLILNFLDTCIIEMVHRFIISTDFCEQSADETEK